MVFFNKRERKKEIKRMIEGTLCVQQMFKPQDSIASKRIGNFLARRQTEWYVCTIQLVCLISIVFATKSRYCCPFFPQTDNNTIHTEREIHTHTLSMLTCSSGKTPNKRMCSTFFLFSVVQYSQNILLSFLIDFFLLLFYPWFCLDSLSFYIFFTLSFRMSSIVEFEFHWWLLFCCWCLLL